MVSTAVTEPELAKGYHWLCPVRLGTGGFSMALVISLTFLLNVKSGRRRLADEKERCIRVERGRRAYARPMARPKSRHGGRVTPKGTRPGKGGGKPRLSPQARYCLDLMEASAVELAASGPDVDEADRWASDVQDYVAFPKTPVGAQPVHVLAHARELGGPAGAAITAALATYGPSRHRATARGQLEQMAAAGNAPPWTTALDSAAPGGRIPVARRVGRGVRGHHPL